jgi:hypothetical protein
MALRSKSFKGDSKLEACLVSDPAHIMLGAVGDHVSKIQKALITLDRASINAGELSGKRFGASTAAAVLAFKTRRSIINRSYQSQPDNVVGKMTIDTLDREMLAAEGPSPIPTPTTTLSIVPFHEPLPMLISKRDHSLSKGDLRSTPLASLASLGVLVAGAVTAARLSLTIQLVGNMTAELGAGGGSLGLDAARDFISNRTAAATITKAVGSPLSSAVKASSEFRSANTDVKRAITAAIRASAATGILDYHVLAERGKKVPPPGLGFSGFQALHVVIGSFQGVSIFLTNFTASASPRTYTAELTYEFFDHFGVDDSDLTFDFRGHGSPGQVALWVLQRERHPGHMPYVLKVVINETVSDSF